MNDHKTGQKVGLDRRASRLRAALRENLKRRKAQAKAKAKGADNEIVGGGRVEIAVSDSPEAQDGKNTPNSAGFAGDKAPG